MRWSNEDEDCYIACMLLADLCLWRGGKNGSKLNTNSTELLIVSDLVYCGARRDCWSNPEAVIQIVDE